MFWQTDATRSYRSPLLLLFGRIMNMDDFLVAVSPLDVVHFLQKWHARSGNTVFEYGGHLVRLEGNCFLAAWRVRSDARELRNACEASLSIIHAPPLPLGEFSLPPRLSFSVVIGNCIYAMKERSIASVFGEPVSRVEEIASGILLTGNSIILDGTINIRQLPWRFKNVSGMWVLEE